MRNQRRVICGMLSCSLVLAAMLAMSAVDEVAWPAPTTSAFAPTSTKNITYTYRTFAKFTAAGSEHLFEHVMNGPPQIHVVCVTLLMNGSAVLRQSWDNFMFPQLRELPFFYMIQEMFRDDLHRRKFHRNVNLCIFLQDGLDQLELGNEYDTPFLSNLCKDGDPTVAIPDHTFAQWHAAKLMPFQQFYDQVMFNRSSRASQPFRDRVDQLFWRGQPTTAGGVRGTSGYGRTELVNRMKGLAKANFNVAFVSVYFNNTDSFVSLEEHAKYRYLIDLPGYGYSGRLKYLLLLGSVVLVVEHPEREYWREFFCPWVHYVPIRRDLTDLVDVLNTLRLNTRIAEAIGSAGRSQAQLMFSQNARNHYMSDVLSAYSRGIALKLVSVDSQPRCKSSLASKLLVVPFRCPKTAVPNQMVVAHSLKRRELFEPLQSNDHLITNDCGVNISFNAKLRKFFSENLYADPVDHYSMDEAMIMLLQEMLCFSQFQQKFTTDFWFLLTFPHCSRRFNQRVLRTRRRENEVASVLPDHTFSNWRFSKMVPFDIFYDRALRDDPLFEAKSDKVYWRGLPLSSVHRLSTSAVVVAQQLALLSKAKSDIFDLQFAASSDFAYDAESDRSCLNVEAHGRFRFLVDVPDYGHAGHLKYLLLLGSVVLVVEHDDRDFSMNLLRPWTHYVPIKRDLSDMDDAIGQLRSNISLAVEIGAAGRRRALQIFDRVSVFSYVGEVLDAYKDGFALTLTGL